MNRVAVTKVSDALQNVTRLTSHTVRKIIRFANVCDIFGVPYSRYTTVYGC
ncbi:protein of unknown function [Pararobbsia alpina]